MRYVLMTDTSAVDIGWQTRHRLLRVSRFGMQLRSDLRLDLARPPFTLARALWSVASKRRRLRQRRLS